MIWAILLQSALLGYALGAIPSGVWLARALRLPDPRSYGSGSTGTTNMLRSGHRGAALATFLMDLGKGLAAVALCAAYISPLPVAGAFTLLLATLGHCYSPWLQFKGGKGIATLLGGAMALSWPVAATGMVLWAIVFFLRRQVSLASLSALTVAPLFCWLRVDGGSALVLACAGALSIWRHRDNIRRLRMGLEPRIHFSRAVS